MKFKHRTLIAVAGALWFVIGLFLLTLGIRFVMESVRDPSMLDKPGCFSILSLASYFVSSLNNAVILLLTSALLLGYIKGKIALGKTVYKQIDRISGLPNPAKLKFLYTKGHYLLIALMIALGFSMRFLPITLDTRGFIDIAIGSALMNGALLYFRSAINYVYLIKKG